MRTGRQPKLIDGHSRGFQQTVQVRIMRRVVRRNRQTSALRDFPEISMSVTDFKPVALMLCVTCA